MTGRNIIFLSGLPWEFIKQRHHHVASRLAEKNQVLFVEPQVSIVSAWRTGKLGKELSTIRSNLFLHRPLPGVPLKKKVNCIYYINSVIIATSIRQAIRVLHLDHPILWATIPEAALLIGKLGEAGVVYDCLDDFKSFPGIPVNLITRLDTRLTKSANVVFTTSEGLIVQKRKLNPNCYLVQNGVDYDLFATPGEASVILRGIPRPIIGYVGMISDWVDFDLLTSVADACSNYSFVLVGPIKCSRRLPSRKNIIFLGEYPYTCIPDIVRGFNVGIIPFRLNELTLNTNPVKVYEYLAAGIPVVSTELPELKTMAAKGYVLTGATPNEWINLLSKAINEQDTALVNSRKRFAQENSWSHRVRQMEEIVDNLIKK